MKLPLRPALAALALSAVCCQATAVGRLVDVNIVDRDTGQQLRTYHHRGEVWVAGAPGHRYAISLRNQRGGRVIGVVSVDGINVVTGETAAPNQSGYVLDGREATEVNGWRKDMAQVAAFYFSDLPESYAARTGRPGNVGVVGVAVFRERDMPRPLIGHGRGAPGEERAAAPSGTGQPQSAAQGVIAPDGGDKRGDIRSQPRLGTGHGERESSRAETTHFTRASSTPDEVVTIRYDSHRNLVLAGIIPPDGIAHPVRPDPFPGRFVPDPR